jgi:hypothetical protein
MAAAEGTTAAGLVASLTDRLLAGKRLRSKNVAFAGWLLMSINVFTVVGVIQPLAAGKAGLAFFCGVLAALVFALSFRAATIGVSMTDDEIIVRNIGSTKRLPMREITAVELGEFAGEAVLRDGRRTRIGALSGSLCPTEGMENSRRRLAEALQRALDSQKAKLTKSRAAAKAD